MVEGEVTLCREVSTYLAYRGGGVEGFGGGGAVSDGLMVSEGHEMYCHDLEDMGSNPCRIGLGVRSSTV